ncbi:hypothetical protein [Rufibacter quisquiliarum]|uniref:Lipoprotein n=1 Tax=Rufibacter quisquiliarum TaxID=1549639 RepID=A0A839GKN5_9BACT|nr:hypothetical protein [Rufibacter quisquiliarum]MBA9079412.1 hypothetical protein [Rufibacter quisquiliarum]
MKKVLQISFLLTIFVGCNSSYIHSSTSHYEAINEGDLYFPLKPDSVEGQENDKQITFMNKWYSENMVRLKEPVLYKHTGRDFNVFRFTKIGTWGESTSYRIEKTDSNVSIVKRTKDLSGNLIADEKKLLSKENWSALEARIQSIAFWHLNTHGERGLDGEEWILEGLDDDKYHFVIRWSPDLHGDKEFVKACNLFEDLFKK